MKNTSSIKVRKRFNIKMSKQKTKRPDRRVRVPHHGAFYIPSHIQRIDIYEPGRPGTHGWQVRTRLPTTKFFGDNTQGRRGPRASLKAALEFRKRWPPRPVLHLQKRSHNDKKNDLPVGITFAQAKKPDRHAIGLRFQVSVPCFDKSNTCRSVFISTRKTFTKKKYQDALVKAIRIRKKVVKQYIQEFNRLISGQGGS